MTSENYVVGWKIPLCSVLRHKGLEIPIGQAKSRDHFAQILCISEPVGVFVKADT